MQWWTQWRDAWRRALDRLRRRLAGGGARLHLSVLGLLCGILAGLVIIAFRQLVEHTQGAFLPGGDPENYEALGRVWRVLLPTAGGLIIGIAFHFLPRAARELGVIHVIERLSYHQGDLPLRHAAVQFLGAAVSIITGHSVGREGPSVHLGAAAGSQLGKRLELPNNTVRVLVACGTAAAIGASFNTPLAGVIFAMEVVMMEYTISGFAPVILAAVSATLLSRAVYGSDPAFSVPALSNGLFQELPWLVVMGVVIGSLAAVFVRLTELFSRQAGRLPVWTRPTLGGLAVGLLALAVPQIMGIGYDTVNAALLGHLSLGVLLGVVGAKLLATTLGMGLGLPGGLIGPTLVVGAAAGGVMGITALHVIPGEDASSAAFYAVIGMGSMMGATLQAPLAALTAMLELTANPNIILPGLLVLIISGIVSSEVYGRQSVFLTLIRARGRDYRADPITQHLRRLGVASAMSRSLVVLPQTIDRARADEALKNNPRWIVVRAGQEHRAVLPGADLARFVQQRPHKEQIDLMEMPADRLEPASIDMQATLDEAHQVLQDTAAGALIVRRHVAPGFTRVHGVLTHKDIESTYRY